MQASAAFKGGDGGAHLSPRQSEAERERGQMEEWHAWIADSTTLAKIISPSGYSAASAISPNCSGNAPPHPKPFYI